MNIKNIVKNSFIFRGKTPLIGSIFAGIIVAICLLGIIMPQTTNADFSSTANASYVAKTINEAKKAVKTIRVVVTAYASVPEETDDTPFITASGQHVAENIVANNMLPFGTKIKIPDLYGDKIFVVGDRMNKKKSDYHIDLWMPSKTMALNFGVKTADIEILQD